MQVRTPNPGLAAYPTDSYYDPNRPSWVPYWIDTPTEGVRRDVESALKYGAYPGVTSEQVYSPGTAYPPPPVGHVPVPSNIVTPGPGAVSEVVVGSQVNYAQRLQDFFTKLAQEQDAAAAAQTAAGVPMWVWIAGAGALVLALAMRR